MFNRADAFGMMNAVVKGLDVYSVYEIIKEIAEDVRKNSVPLFLEIRTYRYRGHSMSDPQNYRTREELEEYQRVDPVERMKRFLLDNKITSKKKIEEIEQEVEQQVLDSVEFAERAEAPAPEDRRSTRL